MKTIAVLGNTPIIETIRFQAGDALIFGNLNTGVKLETVNNFLQESILKLDKIPENYLNNGLFTSVSYDPNYFNGDITVESLKPQDGDYIYPVYRLLSNVVLNHYIPIEMPKDVLKNSLRLLGNIPLYTNHDIDVGNEVGIVLESFWQDEIKVGNTVIPAGINARLRVDSKIAPKLVRSMLSNPPMVKAGSITLKLKWVSSHPQMSPDEFWSKAGTVVNKELVRRVAVDVVHYLEYSFVPMGADPFSGEVGEGGKAKKHGLVQYTTKSNKADITMFDNSLSFLCSNSNNPGILINNNENNQQNDSDMDLQELLTKCGIEVEVADWDAFATHIKALGSEAAKVADLTTSNQSLTDQIAERDTTITSLQGEVTTLKEAAKVSPEEVEAYKLRHTELVTETTNFYKLSVGEADADPAIVSLIAKADNKELVSLSKSYRKKYEDSHPLSCKDCHSTNVERLSTTIEDQSHSNTPPLKGKSFKDVKNEIRNANKK